MVYFCFKRNQYKIKIFLVDPSIKKKYFNFFKKNYYLIKNKKLIRYGKYI